jgi:hypothetical protein
MKEIIRTSYKSLFAGWLVCKTRSSAQDGDAGPTDFASLNIDA